MRTCLYTCASHAAEVNVFDLVHNDDSGLIASVMRAFDVSSFPIAEQTRVRDRMTDLLFEARQQLRSAPIVPEATCRAGIFGYVP